MHKIFNIVRTWFVSLFESPEPDDPLSHMSPRELADLPVYHPRFEHC